MVLPDNIQDYRRQAVAPPQLDAVLDVGGDNQGAQIGRNLLVRVGPRQLVLGKKVRPLQLADIVIVRPHPGNQRVRPHRLRGRFRQIAHQNAVMVRPRRFHQQLAQNYALSSALVNGGIRHGFH